MKTFTALSDDLVITPIFNAPFYFDGLFRQKFGDPAPDYGHAIGCFYRKNWHQFIPLSYTNFLPHEGVILVGGAMTDGSVFRQMPPETRNVIKSAGGIYYQVLLFAFEYLKEECEAFFGHAGDKRAYEIDIRAGFKPTPYEYLIVNFHKPISDERKKHLIEKIHSIGPF